MATLPSASGRRRVEYPSGDGKPVAETPIHVEVLLGLVQLLKHHFAADPSVYVAGNMFVYYVPGDKRRHVAPDVWMARGVGNRDRDYYLVWEEPRGPEMVIEVTSKSTRREDLDKKFKLYRDTLRVTEYFLFDPKGEYLDPPLRGYRLIGDEYVPIERVGGRLPSEVAGLHLERDGQHLRLFDPATGRRIPTFLEAWTRAETDLLRGENERLRLVNQLQQSEIERLRLEVERLKLTEELERLRREVDDLRRRPPGEG
jgi:Uma2 family endonuclease